MIFYYVGEEAFQQVRSPGSPRLGDVVRLRGSSFEVAPPNRSPLRSGKGVVSQRLQN